MTATRPGYLTSSLPTTAASTVRPGVIHNHRAPVVSGKAVVGHTLRHHRRHLVDHARQRRLPVVRRQHPDRRRHLVDVPADRGGRRSADPRRRDRTPRRLHVVVRRRRPAPTRSSSAGCPSTSRPSAARQWSGARSPHTSPSVDPSTATPRYHWYRDDRTRSAARNQATYVVQTARPRPPPARRRDDAGRRTGCSRDRRSAGVTDVRTAPRLHVHTSLRHGRIFLRLRVAAPGLDRTRRLGPREARPPPGGRVHRDRRTRQPAAGADAARARTR